MDKLCYYAAIVLQSIFVIVFLCALYPLLSDHGLLLFKAVQTFSKHYRQTALLAIPVYQES